MAQSNTQAVYEALCDPVLEEILDGMQKIAENQQNPYRPQHLQAIFATFNLLLEKHDIVLPPTDSDLPTKRRKLTPPPIDSTSPPNPKSTQRRKKGVQSGGRTRKSRTSVVHGRDIEGLELGESDRAMINLDEARSRSDDSSDNDESNPLPEADVSGDEADDSEEAGHVTPDEQDSPSRLIVDRTRKRRRSPDDSQRRGPNPTSASPEVLPGDELEAWIETRLTPALLPLSAELDISAVQAARSRCARALRQFKIPVEKNNSTDLASFKPQEVVEVVNWFCDLFSRKGFDQASALLEQCAIHAGTADDERTGALAAKAARDPDTPEIFRRIFGAFSKVAKSINGEENVIDQIVKMQNKLEFLHEYEDLTQRATRRDPVILELLKKLDIHTGKGKNLTTCVIEYLTGILRMQKNKFSNEVQKIRALQNLVNEFTPGVLVLVPSGAPERLHRWGNQKMIGVYGIIQREFPGLRRLCSSLEITILKPMLAKQSLPLKHLRASGGQLSIQQCLDEAVTITEVDHERNAITSAD